MRNRKTKQQLVDDNEQAARIALYLPQLHAQKEKLEAEIDRMVDGKVQEHWFEIDLPGLMGQLGAIPEPEYYKDASST